MDNQKREPVKFDFARMYKDNVKTVRIFLKKRVFKPYARMVCMRMIIFYQRHLSKHTCLYTPTCSQYTLECINNHGAIVGILLGTWRILRCNPFSKGGYDPAPEKYFKKRWLL